MTIATVIVVASASSVGQVVSAFKELHQENLLFASRDGVEFRDGTIVKVVTPHNLEGHLCGVSINQLLISYDIEQKEREAVLFELAYRLTPDVKEPYYF